MLSHVQAYINSVDKTLAFRLGVPVITICDRHRHPRVPDE